MFQTSREAVILFSDECHRSSRIFARTLGRQVKSPLDNERNSQLFSVISLTLSGQLTPQASKSRSSGTRNASLFAILCRDTMTSEIEQKNAAKEAKKQSNNSLPKDIVIRLNRARKTSHSRPRARQQCSSSSRSTHRRRSRRTAAESSTCSIITPSEVIPDRDIALRWRCRWA